MVKIISFKEGERIERIFHISDIHIRLYRRKDEYLYCFNELYKEIRKFPTGKHLIVITGDILHNKLEMSPECETMTFDFLETLSNIYPTLLILGNHDTLLNNRDRMDKFIFYFIKKKYKKFKLSEIYRYISI